MRSKNQIATELTGKADSLLGLVTSFEVAISQLTAQELDRFLDVVPEKGEALWLRFTTWRDSPITPRGLGFTDFIREMIAEPQPQPTP